MNRQFNLTTIILVMVIAILLLSGGILTVSAQDPGAVPTAEGPSPTASATSPFGSISVTAAEPTLAAYGQEVILTILGANFGTDTTVRLLGFGILQTEYVNSSALRATVPGTISPGSYGIEVSALGRGTVLVPGVTFTVMAATGTPPPTSEPLPTNQPLPTREPSTPMPGQPSLVVRNFRAAPINAVPGQSVSLSFEIVNQGSRMAEGISVGLTEGSVFAPANGLASVLPSDIPPGSSREVNLSVIVPLNAPIGPNSISLTMAYRDFSGTMYTNNAVVSVTVPAVPEIVSEITLSRYWIDPEAVSPGEPVKVTVEVANLGNVTIDQAVMRLKDGVLLAGPEGDTFSLGILYPGDKLIRVYNMVVGGSAESGPQAQPVELSYVNDGEVTSVSSSITVNVTKVAAQTPLLLLDSYTIGDNSVLKPGDQFTLTASIKNVGEADVASVLAVFGNVEPDSPGNNPPTTTGNIFAPINSGGSHFISAIEASGEAITLTQDFIVSGSTESGIYSLPLTLLYEDGETKQVHLNASIIVVAPPKLQINVQSPVPPTINVGEPIAISLQLVNTGTKVINLTSASVITDNGDVFDGAEIPLRALKADGEVFINGTVMPAVEGTATISVIIGYTDDLNRGQVLEQLFFTEAVMPPPIDDFPPPFEEPTPEPETEEDDNVLSRFLLGLVGLGS